MALDEDEYSSCVIDCLDYGDQTTARESAEIGDVSEEPEALKKPEANSFKREPQRQQCEPHGLDEQRDPEINHYTCSTIDSQISTLTNDTNVYMVD